MSGEPGGDEDIRTISLAQARKDTGVDWKKPRQPRQQQGAWGDYAWVQILNQPKKP